MSCIRRVPCQQEDSPKKDDQEAKPDDRSFGSNTKDRAVDPGRFIWRRHSPIWLHFLTSNLTWPLGSIKVHAVGTVIPTKYSMIEFTNPNGRFSLFSVPPSSFQVDVQHRFFTASCSARLVEKKKGVSSLYEIVYQNYHPCIFSGESAE